MGYAFVPFSLYRRVLRAGDHVVLVTASMRGSDSPLAATCRDLAAGLVRSLKAKFKVPVDVFFDNDTGSDLARLALADVVLCGGFSTFCLWGAIAAGARGADAFV